MYAGKFGQGTYPIDVVSEHVRVDHGDGFEGHKGDEADDPRDDQGHVLLEA